MTVGIGLAGRTVAGFALLAITVTGCGQGAQSSATAPTDTSSPRSRSSTSTTVVTSTPDPLATCRNFFGDLEADSLVRRIPEALSALADVPAGPDGSIDIPGELHTEFLTINRDLTELIENAPSGMAAPLRKLRQPFHQVAEATGSLTISQSDLESAIITLAQECGDVGYRYADAIVTELKSEPDQPKIVLDESHSGAESTGNFEVAGRYTLKYSFSCGSTSNFALQITSVNGTIVALPINTIAASGGDTLSKRMTGYTSGPYYIESLVGGCDWSVTVTDLPD